MKKGLLCNDAIFIWKQDNELCLAEKNAASMNFCGIIHFLIRLPKQISCPVSYSAINKIGTPYYLHFPF